VGPLYELVLHPGVYEVVQDRVWVDLTGSATQAAINLIVRLVLSVVAFMVTWWLVDGTLRQWDPGRPTAWIATATQVGVAAEPSAPHP
jgi:hypothetical protein